MLGKSSIKLCHLDMHIKEISSSQSVLSNQICCIIILVIRMDGANQPAGSNSLAIWERMSYWLDWQEETPNVLATVLSSNSRNSALSMFSDGIFFKTLLKFEVHFLRGHPAEERAAKSLSRAVLTSWAPARASSTSQNFTSQWKLMLTIIS